MRYIQVVRERREGEKERRREGEKAANVLHGPYVAAVAERGYTMCTTHRLKKYKKVKVEVPG